jgi:hypothetical protein
MRELGIILNIGIIIVDAALIAVLLRRWKK